MLSASAPITDRLDSTEGGWLVALGRVTGGAVRECVPQTLDTAAGHSIVALYAVPWGAHTGGALCGELTHMADSDERAVMTSRYGRVTTVLCSPEAPETGVYEYRGSGRFSTHDAWRARLVDSPRSSFTAERSTRDKL